MTVKVVKYCVWSFKKRMRAKQTLEYAKGAVVTNFPEKDEQEMIDGGYAVKATEADVITENYIEGAPIHPKPVGQVIEVQTKDVRTKPVRNITKTADDNKSD